VAYLSHTVSGIQRLKSISTRSALSLSPKGLLVWFSGKIYGLASCFPTRIPPKLSPNRDLVMSLSLRDVVYVRARADNPLLQAQDENDDKDPKQSCSLRREQVCSPATQRTIKRIELLNEGQPSSHAGCGDISAFSDSFATSPSLPVAPDGLDRPFRLRFCCVGACGTSPRQFVAFKKILSHESVASHCILWLLPYI
jgi:hypothetical protein